MSRRFILLLVIVVIAILNVAFQKMAITNSHSRHDTFRQILQTKVDPTESSSTDTRPNSLTVSFDKESNGNIPDYYFSDKNKQTSRFNNTCAKFPDLFDLRFKNDLWQAQKTSNGTLLLFNAYWDERNGTKIRIVGMYDVHPTRGGTNQYFSIIGMLGTVPDSYLFQIPVTKYLLPPHTVLVIGPALDTVQNSR
jgi:hypothetical protein